MDPTIKSIPTPTPTPAPTPSPATMPTISAQPQATNPVAAQPATQVSAQSMTHSTMSTPAATQPAAPTAPTPTITYPSANGVPTPPAASAAPTISATDPITQPEPAPEPDPIEEALKAPIKPADPVPGSIGSAVSMPKMPLWDEAKAAAAPAEPVLPTNPSLVSNQLPTSAPVAPTQAEPTAELPQPSKKKDNKLLIILCIITGVIVIVLAVIFIMQLIPSSTTSSNTQNNTNNTNVVSNDEEEVDVEDPWLDYVEVVSEYSRPISTSLPAGAISGTESISATFDGDGELSIISRTETITFDSEEDAKAAIKTLKKQYIAIYEAFDDDVDPFISDYNIDGSTISIIHSADTATLTSENCSIFYLTSSDGSGTFTSGEVAGQLKTLGFSDDTTSANSVNEEEA